MKQIKKITTQLLLIAILIGTFVGCSAGKSNNVIKLGINGTDFSVWNYVKKELAKEDIKLEIVSFSDYIQPNLALEQGEIDINAFQTQIYFDNFKKNHKLNIIPFGNTVLAPMGIYSKKYKSPSDVPENGKVSIPNDLTNGGRALLLLQEVGLITIGTYTGVAPEIKNIVNNPKNLEIIPMSAQQIPLSLKDVDLGVINNGIAVTANLKPLKDSIYIENPQAKHMKAYYNIFAIKEKDKNRVDLKRLVEIYQTEAVKKIIWNTYKGEQIPVF